MSSDDSKPAAACPSRALFDAISKGDLAGVDSALAGGASTEAVGADGLLPVEWAAIHDNPDIFMRLAARADDETLFGAPAAANAPPPRLSVFDLALQGKGEACAVALLKSGRAPVGDPRLPRKLALAIFMDKNDVVAALADRCDLAARAFAVNGAEEGHTALEMAAMMGSKGGLEALLRASAADDPPGHFVNALLLSRKNPALAASDGVPEMFMRAIAEVERAGLAKAVQVPAAGFKPGPRV